MRLQLAFRQTNEKANGRTVHIAVGLMRAPTDHLPAEKISTFYALSEAGRLSGLLHAPARLAEPHEDYSGDLRSHAVDDLLRGRIWPIHRDQNDALLLHLRRSRVPSHLDGHEVLIATGLLVESSGLALDYDAVHVFAGFKGLNRVEDLVGAPAMVEATRGSNIGHFLDMPVWGFGSEPIGVASTMHLEINDLLDAQRKIRFFGDPEGADAAEMQRLVGILRPLGLGKTSYEDPQFEKAMRILYANYPDLAIPSSEPRNAATMEQLSAAMRESIETMLAAEDAPRP